MPKVASPKYNLLIKCPEVASQWHPTLNGDKKPEGYTPGSGKKVWWKCERNHEWETTISSRTNGSGCPYCPKRPGRPDYNLLIKYPEVANQWHPTK